MDEWTSQMISSIEENLSKAKASDLRFFRVSEFKRNVERTGSFADKCPACRRNQTDIKIVVAVIENAIVSPGKTRREYDNLISRLAGHMQKEHGYYTPYHFTYRYLFYGMLIGLVTGYLMMSLLSEYNWAYVSGGYAAGLLMGYIYGSKKDRIIREKKMIM